MNRDRFITLILWSILVAFIVAVSTSCKPKQTITTTTTDRVSFDSTAFKHLQRFNDSLVSLSFRSQTKIKELERQNATLIEATLAEADTALPVQSKKLRSGKAFVELKYQGNLLSYRFYLPEVVSSKEQTTDSSAFLQSQLKESREIIEELTASNDSIQQHVNTLEVKDSRPFLVRLIPWWGWCVLTLVAYIAIKRLLPFLPLP